MLIKMPHLKIGDLIAKLPIIQGGFAFAGANAYLVKPITTVKELIAELVQDYSDSCQRSRFRLFGVSR